MTKIESFLGVTSLLLAAASLQAQNAPNNQQVLMYSATMPSGTVPSIFTETAKATVLGASDFLTTVTTASNFTSNQNFVQMSNALNASIATALSIVPLSSPASGVINRKDPATGALLGESSTLGPIFTERAETIGKGHFYIGFSNQDYHFTKYNGSSLNGLNILYPGGQSSQILPAAGATGLQTVPATFGLGMDVRLSQNIAFLTYGVTDRIDVSLGLPMVHSAVSARTYNGTIYAGNGFGTNGSTCWCANTFTPAAPTLIQPQIGQAAYGKTGFGDLLVRGKGTLYRSHEDRTVIAVGADLRLPSGDAVNYLGTGTTSVKPFTAVSFYTKPLASGIVLSPHFDAGWQFSGKSVLGGALTASQVASAFGPPFATSKNYLPDVFSWAAGMEVALGRRSTFVADLLGNQIGLIHGIPNTITQTITGALLPTGVNGDSSGAAVPTKQDIRGLVTAGNVSYGQYNASLGYKVKIAGNLVANFNVLLRLDDNGLAARVVPLFGLGYSFN